MSRNIAPFCLAAAALTLVPHSMDQSAAQGSRNATSHSGASPPVAEAPADRHATTPEVQALIDGAASLPPELESDVLLQVVEAGLIRNDNLRLKIIQRAFDRASAAEDDVTQRPWGRSVEETAEGLHAIASTYTRLSRNSLQTRAVSALISYSPERARRLFESMPPPHLEPPPCNANWYFVPDAYYDALGKILDGGFSTREVKDGRRAAYVVSIIRGTHSHVQLVPVAQLLSDGQFTAAELRDLVPAYAAVLGGLSGDARSFSLFASEPNTLFDVIAKLAAMAVKENVDPRPLTQSLRDYIVLNLKGPSCADPNPGVDSRQGLPEVAVEFNSRFANQLAGAGIEPIGANEIRGGLRSGQAQPLPRWKSQTYSQLLLASQSLTAGHNESAGPASQAWLSRANDLLMQLNTWSDTVEPEAEFFHQKALLLGSLAEQTTGTPLHAEAVEAFVRFLERNAHQQVSAIDWFFHARKFLSRAIAKGNANADLAALLSSREPALSTYARLEIILQQVRDAESGSQANPQAKGGRSK